MSELDRNAFKNNTSLESVKNDTPVFPWNTQQNEMGIPDTKFHGREPTDWALGPLECREVGDVWKRDTSVLRSYFTTEIVAEQNDPPGEKSHPPPPPHTHP